MTLASEPAVRHGAPPTSAGPLETVADRVDHCPMRRLEKHHSARSEHGMHVAQDVVTLRHMRQHAPECDGVEVVTMSVSGKIAELELDPVLLSGEGDRTLDDLVAGDVEPEFVARLRQPPSPAPTS